MYAIIPLILYCASGDKGTVSLAYTRNMARLTSEWAVEQRGKCRVGVNADLCRQHLPTSQPNQWNVFQMSSS